MSFRPISQNTNDLFLNVYESSLKATADAGESTIDIYSIIDFAIDQVICIGNNGNEGSEIILSHASTAPSGNTVTLASNLVKTHAKDTKVYVLSHDQIEWSYATTKTGVKTVFTGGLITINPETKDPLFVNTEASTGYTFARYKNSIDGLFTEYGDAMPIDGYASNTVNSVINTALTELDKETSGSLTYEELVGQINECLRYRRRKLKRWSNLQAFDQVVSQMNRGQYKFALPSTVYDQNSNRSILSVRVGQSEKTLKYIDKRELDMQMEDILHTTVYTQPSVGGTSLVLTSTDDLPSSGSINIYTSNTANTITYTANDKDTNTLSGIPASGDGSITVTHAVDTDVWSGEREATPSYFTVFDGYLYISPLINSTDAGQNIYMDFYTDIVEVDSDEDVLTLNNFDMIKHWLKWFIRAKTENKGVLDLRDPEYTLFLTVLEDAKRQDSSGQKFKMRPRINGINQCNRNNRNPANIWN